MLADFDKYQKEGGKIRTISLPDRRYFRVCYDKDGNPHKGLTKRKKETTK